MTSLLQALLVREYRHLRRLQLDTVESTETLEQMVQRSTRVYLSYIKEHGLLIERLEAEPAIANYGDPSEYGNFATVMYLAQILKDNFGIEIETALVITEISYGLPAAGGRYLIHNGFRALVHGAEAVSPSAFPLMSAASHGSACTYSRS